jgi:hypothetical protein
LRSTSLKTATLRMPSSRQARRMRTAISPRLAIRIFLNMKGVGGAERILARSDDWAGWYEEERVETKTLQTRAFCGPRRSDSAAKCLEIRGTSYFDILFPLA